VSWTHERAKIAALTRRRPPDHPDVVEARRSLRAERLAAKITETVAGWPPLTEQQKASLAILLLGGERPSVGEESSP
jgi:hypothetical protein